MQHVTKKTLRGTLKIACLAAFCAVLLCGCGGDKASGRQITAASQLNDPSVTIGVAVSTPEEKVLAELFPDFYV